MEQHDNLSVEVSNSIDSAIREQHRFNQKKWDLCWIVGGVVKEVLERNKSRGVLLWEKKKKENSTHTMGKLVLLETGTHPY